MTRRLAVVAAVLAIAAGVYAQATPYARAPLVAGSTYAGHTHAQIAAETDCPVLRQWYHTAHNVWRGGVKDGHEPPEQLDAMRELLLRLEWLESRGKCGG